MEAGWFSKEYWFDRFCQDFLRHGRTTVQYPSGRHETYGHLPGPHIAFRLTSNEWLGRIMRDPELQLGEAFVDGGLKLEEGDLGDGLASLLQNARAHAPGALHGFLKRLRTWRHDFLGNHTEPGDLRDVAHHYDLDRELFELFLDSELHYSCAYFESDGIDLEEAQRAKTNHIVRKLHLREGLSVLDIGCGWGGLAIDIARQANVTVVGLTLSEAQLVAARKRAEEAGLAGRVQFHLQDYRKTEGTFDRIVSVGMFEHVGADQYPYFFRLLHERLASDGIAVVHSICRSDGPGYTNPWLSEYIFPGGYIPALSETLPHVEQNKLYLGDLEIWRLHYAKTLKAWRQRFNQNRDQIRKRFDERFCRMWEFYLASSEAAFRTGQMNVFQMQLLNSIEAAPLCRDYMFKAFGDQGEPLQVTHERNRA